MNILALDFDGKMAKISLMQLAAMHLARGDRLVLRKRAHGDPRRLGPRRVSLPLFRDDEDAA